MTSAQPGESASTPDVRKTMLDARRVARIALTCAGGGAAGAAAFGLWHLVQVGVLVGILILVCLTIAKAGAGLLHDEEPPQRCAEEPPSIS